MEPLQLIFLSVLIFASQASELEDVCPTTDIKPCTCKTYVDGACIITCGLASQVDIDRLGDIPNLCNGHIRFMLVHSKVSGIHAKLWRKLLSSKTVDVAIKHSGMDGIIPPGSESIGKVSTSGEAVIKFDHLKVGQWDWKELSNFNSKELTIVIDDTPLAELGDDFSRISNGQVHKINIDSAGLSKVQDSQFVPFTDLSSLSLQNNKLTSVSRSMIAKPAKKLQFLHLNGNSLSTIPGDLFSEMPALEVVYLRDNNLKFLPQELFQSVVSPKLQRVDLVNNPWECNCSLVWILKNSKVFANLGECASPESLSGKKVRNLSDLLEC